MSESYEGVNKNSVLEFYIIWYFGSISLSFLFSTFVRE